MEKDKGILLVFFAGLIWGIGSFFSKIGVTLVGPWSASYLRTIVFFPVVLGFILWRGNLTFTWNRSIAYSVLAGLLTGGAILLARKALEFYDVSVVNPVLRLNILVTILLSILILKETITWRKSLGILFALTALILLSM